jgi:hypothetical protein
MTLWRLTKRAPRTKSLIRKESNQRILSLSLKDLANKFSLRPLYKRRKMMSVWLRKVRKSKIQKFKIWRQLIKML